MNLSELCCVGHKGASKIAFEGFAVIVAEITGIRMTLQVYAVSAHRRRQLHLKLPAR